MPTDKEIEDKAQQIYLSRYGHIGGLWRLVETKNVWRKMAREWLEATEEQKRNDLSWLTPSL
jgi:hypothetical protein